MILKKISIFIIVLIISTINASIAFSKNLNLKEYNKYLQEIPIYPTSKIYDLDKKLGIKSRALITEDIRFEKIMQFYVRELTKKGWTVIFPNEAEIRIWFEALNSDRTKPPVITLILNKIHTKVNCNLMIGIVKDERLTKDLAIINIYLTETVIE